MNKLKIAMVIGATALSLPSTASAQAEAPAAAAVDKSTLGPAAAAELLAKDMSVGNIVSMWDALPASYQKDVQTLVTEFSNNVDPQIYDEAMSIATLALDILNKKKGLALEMMEDADEENVAALTENYDDIILSLQAIVKSDIQTSKGLKNLKVAQFVSDMQPKLTNLADIMKALPKAAGEDLNLEQLKAEVLEQNEETAKLKITQSNGDIEEVQVIKKEGRWIPKEMAKEWSDKMDEAKEGIAELGKMSDEEKQQALMGMTMAKGMISQLENINSKEELMQLIGPMLGGGL